MTTGGMVFSLGCCFMVEISVSCFRKFLQYWHIIEDESRSL